LLRRLSNLIFAHKFLLEFVRLLVSRNSAKIWFFVRFVLLPLDRRTSINAFVMSNDENVRLDQRSDGKEGRRKEWKWTIVITLFFRQNAFNRACRATVWIKQPSSKINGQSSRIGWWRGKWRMSEGRTSDFPGEFSGISGRSAVSFFLPCGDNLGRR